MSPARTVHPEAMPQEAVGIVRITSYFVEKSGIMDKGEESAGNTKFVWKFSEFMVQ
jgi:hypothetical protein